MALQLGVRLSKAKRSLRFRITLGVALLVLVMLAFLVGASVLTISLFSNQILATSYSTIEWKTHQLGESLSAMDRYLVSLPMYSSDYLQFSRDDDSVAFHVAQANLRQEMEKSLPSHRQFDGLFIFSSSGSSYIDVARYQIAPSARRSIRGNLLRAVGDQSGAFNGWRIGGTDGEAYLYRLLRGKNVWYGAWLGLDSLYKNLLKDESGNGNHSFVVDSTGLIYPDLGGAGAYILELIGSTKTPLAGHLTYHGERYQYYLTTIPSSTLRMLWLIDYRALTENSMPMQTLLRVIFLSLLVLLPVFGLLLGKWILPSVTRAADSIKSLTNERYASTTESELGFSEFDPIYAAVRSMEERIEQLLDVVYKQGLEQRKTELQFLQLQVNPHFFINCLNGMYHLAAQNEDETVMQLAEHLARHLRYTLHQGMFSTLQREISHVENFVEIQKVRYPNRINLEIRTDPRVLCAQVPILVIQTFVENTIKHQLRSSESITIKVEAHILEDTSPARILIRVGDTGDGYPERVLEMLNQDPELPVDSGLGIGIRNLKQRLELMHPGESQVTLYNTPEGGACAEVVLPFCEGPEGLGET